MRYLYVNTKGISPVIPGVISKLENFSRFKAVLYTVNVAISLKWRKEETLVLHIINIKSNNYGLRYRIVLIQDHLLIHLLPALPNAIFVALCSI